MKVFAYWHSPDLNDFLKNSIKTTIENNPYLDYQIYDDEKAKTFLNDNFDKEVLNAYNGLKPHAFKSDLFRYCVLYIYGGLYIDCKMIVNPIDISFFLNHEYHFAKSFKRRCVKWKPIQNCFLYFKKPNNPKLMEIIDRIVNNVKNRDKTCHDLYLTGPILIGEYFQDTKPTLKFSFIQTRRQFFLTYNGYFIVDNDLSNYYTNKHQSYWKMWKSKTNSVFELE